MEKLTMVSVNREVRFAMLPVSADGKVRVTWEWLRKNFSAIRKGHCVMVGWR